MRKSGIPTPTPGHQSSPPPGRRMRTPEAEPPDAPPQNALKRTKKAHFLEPYRLSETGRTALLDDLTRHTLGDPESRLLFAAAVEYGIAGCRATPKETQPRQGKPIAAEPAAPPTPHPTAPLSALAETARLLARGLGALDSPSREAIVARLRASDPFDRLHDQAYLDAVCREIERIAEAASGLLDTPPLPPPVPAPASPDAPIEETARRLVRRIADAYESCFETKVETGAGSPFIPVLRLIAEEAGVELPAEDAKISAVLARR
jgi:hypothetical protein